MAEEKLFVIYGAGPDQIGLVGKITTPLAAAGGNIVDLRQDVLHGLFTIYLVVDFKAAAVDVEQCGKLVGTIAEDAALALSVERFRPVPRDPEKKNLLLILVGEDKPGVAARISATLSRYRINIEFSKMIAREDVFLMELLVDYGQAAIPLANLEREVVSAMAEMRIKAVVQREDVFNKRKRLLAFSFAKSLLPQALGVEIARQAGLEPALLKKTYSKKKPAEVLSQALSLLENLPEDVLKKIASGVKPSAGTQELVQTLKTFGYRVALVAWAAEPLVNRVTALLGLDAGCGYPYPIDPDLKQVRAEAGEAVCAFDDGRFIRELAEREKLTEEDVTVIRDAESAASAEFAASVEFTASVPPGIRLDWDIKTILELYNQRVLTRDQLLGLCGAFGVPSF